MDDQFFKSVLTAHDSSVLDDTSLALPADLRSSTQPDEDRNQRVHRQVKLTMSRKSKKTQSNGNVHFENESASYFDAFGRNRVYVSQANEVVLMNEVNESGSKNNFLPLSKSNI